VRRSVDLEHGIGDGATEPGQCLLQLRLVVDVRRQRVLDARPERADDGLLDRLEAVLEEERRERRLEQRREHVPIPREPLELLVGHRGAACHQALAEAEVARHDGAASARDDVRAHLRQPALGEVGVVVVERAGDRELEHAVAEELEPLVRRGAVRRPGRVGEDVLEPLLGELLDQAFERSEADGGAAATGGSRRSRRPDRRS
jgi:hypothetical protein